MSFNVGEVGIERGATKLLLDRAPRVLDRWNEGGPVRASTTSLPGTVVMVEYHQDTDRRELRLALEKMTEAQVSTLRDLMDDPGVVSVKLHPTVVTTIDCVFTGDYTIEPLTGAYPETAPTRNKWHRAELLLLRV